MEARVGRWLPRSSAHNIIRGLAVPRDIQQYIAFLDACEISGSALHPWFEAWVKIRGNPRRHDRGHRIFRSPNLSQSERQFVNWLDQQDAVHDKQIVAFGQPEWVVINGQHTLAYSVSYMGGPTGLAA
ncbi:hypothetical protein [Streptomyces agglomeratus]|uniref:hypothetical protein n=1 Tax=Streptomyces agglomeratus TaxID=285458 RepID=UPI000854CC85|nr:hypothetical protein [Streptomyces agglomeratus]OEJ49664.1 hypothetical protein BGK72_01445 [Streptomyces agglomeratus]